MKTLYSVVSCLSDYDPDALPLALARRVIGELAQPVADVETAALCEALDRVLGADVDAAIDVPSADNAAMDGFAFAAAELTTAAGNEVDLTVIGAALAGHPYPSAAAAGQCVRIMTGAVMPPGLDTVIPYELVEESHARIRFPAANVSAGANRRLAGEDIARGSVALGAGRRLRAADIGLLASLGVAEVPVRRRLRVAFFSTGDELRPLGAPLPPGCVYDSNRHTVRAMLQRLGVEPIDLGIVPDTRAALAHALDAAAQADAVISTGGVSVGDADFVREVLAERGETLFWKIAMRPGRPFAFGRLKGTAHAPLFFGLPGNPVAVMVTFYQLVRDALLRLAGAEITPATRLLARSTRAIPKRARRTEFARGVAEREAGGGWQVTPLGAQGSGILSSMSKANCFIVLEPEQGPVAVGDDVEVTLFEGLT